MGVAIYRGEIIDDFALVPDVVAGGEDVDAEIEQIFCQRRSNSETGGGVLSVGEDKVNAVLANDSLQLVTDDGPAGPPEDIADEECAHWFDGNKRRRLTLGFGLGPADHPKSS